MDDRIHIGNGGAKHGELHLDPFAVGGKSGWRIVIDKILREALINCAQLA
jgi:hypothetical protein